jgi:acid stress chaperone HdeB
LKNNSQKGKKYMKIYLCLPLACLLVVASTKVATSETVDIATIRCSEIASMNEQAIVIMMSWMDGYLGGRAEDTRLDWDRAQSNADAADKACQEDPTAGVLSVLKEIEATNAQ